MRPNQILAVSLTYSMLSKEVAKAVVEAVRRELFTPYGLRSLSPAAVRYRGSYVGDPVARDSSYHQGPAWAWLLGPFIDVYLKVNGKKAQMQVREWLQVFSGHLAEAGLGHVSRSSMAIFRIYLEDVSLRHGASRKRCERLLKMV
jgi:glycogen debranching enzyme